MQRARGGQVLSRIAWLVLAAGLIGCEADSFFDPSVVGRWEYTPTELPILDRLDVIEDDEGDFDEATDVTAEDLQPVIEEYRFGPGDLVRVEVMDLYGGGQFIPFERMVDGRGLVDLSIIGEVRAQGQTMSEFRDRIIRALQDRELVIDPMVSVLPLQQRQNTFSIYGGVAGGAGTLFVSRPDFRMLQAITEAGGIIETTPYLYVIRQIPLTYEAETGVTPTGERYEFTPEPVRPPDETDQTLEDVLIELLGDDGASPPPAMLPGEVHRRPSRVHRTRPAPKETPTPTEPEPVDVPLDLPTEEDAEGEGAPELVIPTDDQEQEDAAAAAPIDLPGDTLETAPMPEPLPVDLEPAEGETDGQEALIDLPDVTQPGAAERTWAVADRPSPYIFVNGEWVLAQPRARAGDAGDALPTAEPVTTVDPITGEVMTQRIIRVPVKELLRGEARYNMVIRPGDVIRVPPPAQGNIYLGGDVNRPGTYALPMTGRMTLKQAIIAAGGLNQLGIPERVDLVRRIGHDREAMVRLNLRAIFEGTEPDLFLKPNDIINVGTNWAAAPLAVIRNGLRASYGFGFLLDRNFGYDVFGPPPRTYE